MGVVTGEIYFSRKMDVMVYTRLLHESLAQRDTDTRRIFVIRSLDVSVNSGKQNISYMFVHKKFIVLYIIEIQSKVLQQFKAHF